MKSINLKIIVFALFISTVSFAQKYTKTDNSEVKKNGMKLHFILLNHFLRILLRFQTCLS